MYTVADASMSSWGDVNIGKEWGHERKAISLLKWKWCKSSKSAKSEVTICSNLYTERVAFIRYCRLLIKGIVHIVWTFFDIPEGSFVQ